MQEKQEAWILSVGREDPVEKEMATYSSILARKSHGQRSKELETTACTHTQRHYYSTVVYEARLWFTQEMLLKSKMML